MEGTVEVYEYNRVPGVTLAPWEAAAALAIPSGERRLLTVDLGRRHVIVERIGDTIVFHHPRWSVEVEAARLEEAAQARSKAYHAGLDGRVRPVEVREGGYYKLLPLQAAPPTLEINGIHMHRIWGTDPGRDTRAKLRAARVRRGHVVLDTCMGLGYTAIASLHRGASHVVTVEVDENVILVARHNPWSEALEDPRIDVVHGDVTRIVWMLREESFDRIIHDPPRIGPSTGDLYGEEFYRRLYDLLKPGGILFHYTGEPGKKRGATFPGRVAGRLGRVGFHVLGFDEAAKGVVAVKGRRAA